MAAVNGLQVAVPAVIFPHSLPSVTTVQCATVSSFPFTAVGVNADRWLLD